MKPMLASKWEERNESMFPYWVQPKYDGIRCLIADDGYAYSRSLKPIRNYDLQAEFRKHKDLLAGLDGEIIVGEPTSPDCYVRTSSAVMSFENPDITHATFYVFDMWNSPDTYDERYEYLITLVDKFPSWIRLAPNALIRDQQMLDEFESVKLIEGHEGVILRNPQARYKFGRGTPKEGQLIKLKRFDDMEGKIIDFHEEMHNANEPTIGLLGNTERSGHKANLIGKSTLGAIEVELGDPWNSKSVRIGTGFDAGQREKLWQKKEELIGKIAKFKYFAVGSKDAPRFPVFLGMRDADDMEPAQGSLF